MPQINLKTGLAEMLKNGVIMDVMNVEQAKIAEAAGAVAVMALERIPSLIRTQGGVARMSDPQMIKEIMAAVSIPVMAKCRIGHFVEAQILHDFKVPFVCGCTDLGEALRRIAEGAALIRTKGEAGTGNVVEAVRHMRTLKREIGMLNALFKNGMKEELASEAKRLRAPLEIVMMVAESGRLPVPNFSAGGVATPADAALMMQLGAETVFVGSGIFADATSEQAKKRAEAIVKATLHFRDPKFLLESSTGLPKSMTGIEMKQIPEESRLAQRGW